MARILNIESATTMCSAAIGVEGRCIDYLQLNDGYTHAEKLAPFIDELLNRNNLGLEDIDAIAVSKGPGSYTGLRIGVSLAKGLCFAANKPLIAISTLEIMCQDPEVVQAAKNLERVMLCPMLDARRMEVFCALYGSDWTEQDGPKAMIIDEYSFEALLSQNPVLFFGTGAKKFQLLNTAGSARFVDDVWPLAANMTHLSEALYLKNQIEDLAYFEPFYLKEFYSGNTK